MSSQPVTPPRTAPDEKEIKIVSHSNLFYWWPVWAVGLLMALLTWINGHKMVVVPKDSEILTKATVQGERTKLQDDKQVIEGIKDLKEREVVVLPERGGPDKDKETVAPEDLKKTSSGTHPKLFMATNHAFGVIFALTLLLVIVITNVPLRGLWSLVIIITVVLVSIIFGLAGWWETIFDVFGHLDIRINMGGYLFISLVLFGIWLLTFIFFDRQTYMIFTPGQLKVCTEIGGGEKAYDTMGMTIEKQRSDLFRHWILGIGSGDLIVNTSGAHVHHFDLPNVLFISKKVQLIEDLLREKSVVRGD